MFKKLLVNLLKYQKLNLIQAIIKKENLSDDKEAFSVGIITKKTGDAKRDLNKFLEALKQSKTNFIINYLNYTIDTDIYLNLMKPEGQPNVSVELPEWVKIKHV